MLTETNTLTFDGAGHVASNALAGHRLAIDTYGPAYETVSEGVSTGIPVVLSESGDGNIVTIGGEEIDGFVNDGFDFIAIVSGSGMDMSEDLVGQPLMVKLPTSAPEVTGKRYRLMAMSLGLSGSLSDDSSEVALSNTQFTIPS